MNIWLGLIEHYKVKRIFLERTKEESVREALSGTHYNVVIDKIAYCSNDIKYVIRSSEE